MSEKRSKFQGLFDAVEDTTPQTDEVHAPDKAVAGAAHQGSGQSGKKPKRGDTAKVTRTKTTYKIRQDYQRKLKEVADDEGRKTHQVLEEAIEHYLRSRRRL